MAFGEPLPWWSDRLSCPPYPHGWYQPWPGEEQAPRRGVAQEEAPQQTTRTYGPWFDVMGMCLILPGHDEDEKETELSAILAVLLPMVMEWLTNYLKSDEFQALVKAVVAWLEAKVAEMDKE